LTAGKHCPRREYRADFLRRVFRPVINATKTIPIIMTGGGADPIEAGFVTSLARPGGNVTGVTNLVQELGGKRLELLKEAVPKLARVAVLYSATAQGSARELKEVLPVAARALGLTIRSWGFELRTNLKRYSLR
jgi:ABC-type uncharacterized transport system substrate-binding protein